MFEILKRLVTMLTIAPSSGDSEKWIRESFLGNADKHWSYSGPFL